MSTAKNPTEELKVTTAERRRYVLSKKADLVILAKCKNLERMKLANHDRIFVKLIKAQLKRDWRTPLLKSLNSILKKYQ